MDFLKPLLGSTHPMNSAFLPPKKKWALLSYGGFRPFLGEIFDFAPTSTQKYMRKNYWIGPGLKKVQVRSPDPCDAVI